MRRSPVPGVLLAHKLPIRPAMGFGISILHGSKVRHNVDSTSSASLQTFETISGAVLEPSTGRDFGCPLEEV